jgi:hypothetical protein
MQECSPPSTPRDRHRSPRLDNHEDARLARTLAWTDPRVVRWRDTDEIPGPVMVWTPEQTGAFLDHAVVHDPGLYPLLHLIAYRGVRRARLSACSTPTPSSTGRTRRHPADHRRRPYDPAESPEELGR